MGTIAQAVEQAVTNCLKVQPGEKAVVITDRQTAHIGAAIKDAIEAITGPVEFFTMEDFGPRPIGFPQSMGEALSAADVSVYAAQGAPGELQTFRMKMLRTIEANPKLRHAHMIGITDEIMCDGMCSDYAEIQRISKLVYERVKSAAEIRVVNEAGSDFTARFDPAIKWLVSDGDVQPGHWKNLPDGEVFTAPADVNGTIVIDGCLGDFFTEKYGSIRKTPVSVKVESGRAIESTMTCDNADLLAEFKRYVFATDDNSSRVGEFAIGTNTGLTKLIYNLLQDEKFPGIHVAFGSPLPGRTGADWDSKAHVDGVIISPDIYVDGQPIMRKGVFTLESA